MADTPPSYIQTVNVDMFVRDISLGAGAQEIPMQWIRIGRLVDSNILPGTGSVHIPAVLQCITMYYNVLQCVSYVNPPRNIIKLPWPQVAPSSGNQRQH